MKGLWPLLVVLLLGMAFTTGLWAGPKLADSAPRASEGCYFVRLIDGTGKVHEWRSTGPTQFETGYNPALHYDNSVEWGSFVQVDTVMWVGADKACLAAKGVR